MKNYAKELKSEGCQFHEMCSQSMNEISEE